MQYSLRFSYAALLILFASLIFIFPGRSLAAEVTITMTDSTFSPRNVVINPGDTVRWINTSSIAHTAIGDNGSFDSGTVAAGQSFAAMFNAPGTYAYHCNFHGGIGGVGQAGTITVNSSVITNTNVNTGALTPAQIQAQAQILLNQIAVLQAQLGVAQAGNVPAAGVVTDSSSCPLVGRTLKKGASGSDVTRLQQFLARDPSIYPEANISGYYGALTERAVQRWQAKYNIVSSGTPESTGYGVVGPRTAAAIALLCTTGSYGGIPGPSAPVPVGGFITVSPVSGNAPLAVNIIATVNTTKSCLAATYTLDFGDGSPVQQIPVSAGNCTQINQNYSHAYKYGGTYTIKLSAGGHETTATVTVSGPPAPVFTPDLPRESFTASPTSGNAPLNVTFSGIVNSNDAGFCVGGCASTLDFGDGSLASVNLPASVGGWLNYSVTHTYTQSGGFRATLYQGGAGASQPIVGAVTIIVGSGSSTGSGSGSYSYNPPSITSSGTDPLTFTVSFDIPSSCTGYNLSWGDGSSNVTQSDGGSSCAQTPALKTFTRTYAQSGSYTITLKRGPSLSRIDDVTLTISN
ncbi:MAG: plastocyanin/azurin family copper-binding protein [Patescibacteria group bacterium]